MRITGTGVAETGRALRRSTEELAATVARTPMTEAGRAGHASRVDTEPIGEPGPLLPPEPDTSELVIRATHVEAPPAPAELEEREQEPPEQLELEPEQSAEPRADHEASDAAEEPALTPQGRFRASVTDDPDFVWRVPSARFLVRSTGDAASPTRGTGADRARRCSRRSATSESKRR